MPQRSVSFKASTIDAVHKLMGINMAKLRKVIPDAEQYSFSEFIELLVSTHPDVSKLIIKPKQSKY